MDRLQHTSQERSLINGGYGLNGRLGQRSAHQRLSRNLTSFQLLDIESALRQRGDGMAGNPELSPNASWPRLQPPNNPLLSCERRGTVEPPREYRTLCRMRGGWRSGVPHVPHTWLAVKKRAKRCRCCRLFLSLWPPIVP